MSAAWGGAHDGASTSARRGTLVDDVVALLADRVPAGVLDRMLVELLGAESDDRDRDLWELLEKGTIGVRLRGLNGVATHLAGIRADRPSDVVSRIRMYAEAYRVDVSSCSMGKTVWLLGTDALRSQLPSLLEQLALPGVLAVGHDLSDLRHAPSRRASMEELLTVGQRRGWTGLVQTSRLEAAMRVEVLLDLAARQPELLEGQLDVLLDDPAHAAFAETFYQWFACGRDTSATALATHMHVNTVRYRLRRAMEISGIDVSDWDQRLVAEVQLRMWKASSKD